MHIQYGDVQPNTGIQYRDRTYEWRVYKIIHTFYRIKLQVSKNAMV